ncbi:MAG TPA: ABC transporter ATP-binding protein [Gemmatimonadales bacterium]|nr:ABC transporter ATP-binding protein [Gemmatimonadales bacterium]
MIHLDGVRVAVGPAGEHGFALHDVTLDVPAGAYAYLVGPSGAGKTTLLEAIAGHLPLAAGRVALAGADVTAAPPEARGVGVVYQAYHLFPHLSVRENIGYGLRRRPVAERAARVEALAQRVGLEHLLARRTAGLSGGEQQRVALARALAPGPRVLLLDEPFAAVDPVTRRQLRRELRALHRSEGLTTLHVTHDVGEALRLGDRLAVLVGGRLLQAGAPDAVRCHPATAEVAALLEPEP